MGLTVVDAGVLIGYLDRNDVHHQAAHQALRQALDRNDRIVLPASALAEALVGPSRSGSEAVAAVQEVVGRVPIEIADLDTGVAIVAAGLRARHRSIKLPDALVIATTMTLGADRLVTTDRGWPTPRKLGLAAALVVLHL